MDAYKHYLFLVLITCITILLFVAGINYFVDPTNNFRNPDYEIEIANMLANGNNVSGIFDNDDHRTIQKYWIPRLKKKPTVVAFGSSRSGMMNKNYFPDNEVFINNTVPGGSIEDFIALYHIYQSNHMHPHTVILEVSPWSLNANNNLHHWKTLRSDLLPLLTTIGLPNINRSPINQEIPLQLQKYFQLFSLSYLRTSLNYLLEYPLFRPYPASATQAMELDLYLKHTDGSYALPKIIRMKTAEERLQETIRFTQSSNIYSLNAFNELDPFAQKIFEHFVDYLQKTGTTVIFFFPPYHPITYQKLAHTPQYANVLKAEAYFKQLATSHHIQMVGSYNAETIGVNPEYFYDGMHTDQQGGNIIFKEIGHLIGHNETNYTVSTF